MAQDGRKIEIQFELLRADDAVGDGTPRSIYYWRKMDKEIDGNKVEYTTDANGNFKLIWHQKDGDLFADYSKVLIHDIYTSYIEDD